MLGTVVILWDLQFTWKMTFCHLSSIYVMVLFRYILDHLKLKNLTQRTEMVRNWQYILKEKEKWEK